MLDNISKKGGEMARIGYRFHQLIDKIQKERLQKHNTKKLISTEKITNLMIKHKSQYLEKIAKDIIDLPEEELENTWR